LYKCSNSCLWCSCWWNLDFSFKSYGKESLYKYCMNVDDGRIMRFWRSCLLIMLYHFLSHIFLEFTRVQKYQIGLCCISTKHSLRSKNKGWLVQNDDNVSESSDYLQNNNVSVKQHVYLQNNNVSVKRHVYLQNNNVSVKRHVYLQNNNVSVKRHVYLQS
jgi:hypothetical protein